MPVGSSICYVCPYCPYLRTTFCTYDVYTLKQKKKTTQGWVSVALDATLSRWGITIPRGWARQREAGWLPIH